MAGGELHELMGLEFEGLDTSRGSSCRRICLRPRASATYWSRRFQSSKGKARGANGKGGIRTCELHRTDRALPSRT